MILFERAAAYTILSFLMRTKRSYMKNVSPMTTNAATAANATITIAEVDDSPTAKSFVLYSASVYAQLLLRDTVSGSW